ncbi:hypothetical protein BJ878DRAFT_461485 [Calycina marina]|uniref:25S rRNA (Uridine(2843)-N(3))-methyltransferase n=1 Tax=Calycina marina TaxID=1763456 RepID=A0A9P7Z231_9HELO|nr:hypothetical protein BJ878DRAFT_461485 [Calycina marina]
MSQYERLEKSRRKHEPSNSGASRKPPPLPTQRPEWRGPSFQKKPTKTTVRPPPINSSSIQLQLLSLDLQQLLLNIFRTTFPIAQDPEGLKPVLQKVKDALFRRDFEKAFGKEEWCEAYAVRWSPSRVLCYSNVLAWLLGKCKEERWVKGFYQSKQPGDKQVARVLCLGGGAAEVVAFHSLVRHLHPTSCGKPEGQSIMEEGLLGVASKDNVVPILKVRLLDAAPWENVVSSLNEILTSPPALSKYASATARANNASFIQPQSVCTEFTKADIFSLNKESLGSIMGDDPTLITLFFTLNELYTTSLAKTTKFLLELTLATTEGCLLCVIDSVGSYSETVAFAEQHTQSKRYPMHSLMDHTLLGHKKGKGGLWKKLIVDENRWYRLEESLKYPISLENMRFQVHLFKRL